MGNMKDIDFVMKMLARYEKHLLSVRKAFQRDLARYDSQLASLERLGDDPTYRVSKQETEFKKSEVLAKLASIEENIRKLSEELVDYPHRI